MLHTNWHHIPGPGDQSPPEPIDTAAREAARPEALKVIADFVFAERMTSLAWISDAQGDFTQAEYDAQVAAISEAAIKATAIREAEARGVFDCWEPRELDMLLRKIGSLFLAATEASIRRGAEKEAAIRLDRLEREDEADYYAERVTS